MRKIAATLLSMAICAPAFAQHSGAPSGAPKRQCLSDADLELIATLKALTRPTRPDDPSPPFNPDYFVGTWAMEYEAPDTPLAAAGMHTGTATFRHVDGCYYEGELKAMDPDGAGYATTIQVMYDPIAKYLTWIEVDSRGYTLFKPGTIGADSGGYFTHYFETQAFRASKNGPELHVKGSTFLASPSNFRIRRSLSVDGDAYMNIGEMWFRKR
ncbi:MAG TPA: hypothetical protein VG871_19500 [Vicinamibacterales bacterium]|nr:hypothetical protein [Vicinamibacterales bacterium]